MAESNESPTNTPSGGPESLSAENSAQTEPTLPPPETLRTDEVDPSRTASMRGELGSRSETDRRRLLETLQHNTLKVKEYFGIINEPEFQKLLKLDFQDELLENPPIDKLFIPQLELEKVKALTKEERREALTEFKENLAHQREAWAVCRTMVERYIEFNHDVAKENLMEIVERFGQRYGFSPDQKAIAENLLDRYYQQRQRTLETRQKFPDNRELIYELTRTGFTEEEMKNIKVAVGPMSIDIEADANKTLRMFTVGGGDVPASEEQINKISAFAGQSQSEKTAYYTVLRTDRRSPILLPHEREHNKNRIFREIFFQKEDFFSTEIAWRLLLDVNSPVEVRQAAAQTYFENVRAEGLEAARDEVVATKKGNQFAPTGFRGELSELFVENGNYDYFGNFRRNPLVKNDPLIEKAYQKIMVDEYREIVQRGWYSFDDLAKMGKCSVDEAVALLTNEPLEKWPKAVRRQLEAKGVQYH